MNEKPAIRSLFDEEAEIKKRAGRYIHPVKLGEMMKTAAKVMNDLQGQRFQMSYEEMLITLAIVEDAIGRASYGHTDELQQELANAETQEGETQ